MRDVQQRIGDRRVGLIKPALRALLASPTLLNLYPWRIRKYHMIGNRYTQLILHCELLAVEVRSYALTQEVVIFCE